MKRPERQAGFSIVSVLGVVVIVALLSVGGWFVFQHNKTKLTNAAANGTPATSNQTTGTPIPTPTAEKLDIKEWGVHMTLDSTTASMYYYINPQVPDVAYLSLRTLSNIAPDCAADKISLGAIGRLTEAEQENATTHPSVLNEPGTVHIGNYWYSFSTPQAGCIESTDQDSSISKVLPSYNHTSLQNIFNTLTADSTTN